jgi:hypothetical protein
VIKQLKLLCIYLFVIVVITGCYDNDKNYIKIFLTDNRLNISLKKYDSDNTQNDVWQSGYFNVSLYQVRPGNTNKYSSYYGTGHLYVVIPESIADDYKLDFNGGIYLVDGQNTFIGVEDNFVNMHSAGGISYNLNNSDESDYSVYLNEIPVDYKAENIIYFVNCEYNYTYKDNSVNDVKYGTDDVWYLYRLPIKESLMDNDTIVLIPDYENIKHVELRKHNIKTPIGTFTGILKTDKDTIQELYTEMFSERKKEAVVQERNFIENIKTITAFMAVLGVYLLLESNGMHFE